MEKEDLLKNINSRLEKLGIQYDSLDYSIQKNLLKIESEVSKRFDILNSSLESIQSNRININTISKSGVISNKTVYTYDVLNKYIKLCETEYSSYTTEGKLKEKELREKLREALDIIKKLDIKTVDIELLKMENAQLKNDASDDAEKISKLLEENNYLRNELKLLKQNQKEDTSDDASDSLIIRSLGTLN